jgi:hypothetical protein
LAPISGSQNMWQIRGWRLMAARFCHWFCS